MRKQWRLDYTKLTILAVFIMLPVGIACAVKKNEWEVLCLFFAVLGLDFRIKRVNAQEK